MKPHPQEQEILQWAAEWSRYSAVLFYHTKKAKGSDIRVDFNEGERQELSEDICGWGQNLAEREAVAGGPSGGERERGSGREKIENCPVSVLVIVGTLCACLVMMYALHILSGQGSWSYLGTDATRVPKESFTMNLGFVDRPTVLHEFGHSLGLIHEHQSPFPGGFEWNREEVRKTHESKT